MENINQRKGNNQYIKAKGKRDTGKLHERLNDHLVIKPRIKLKEAICCISYTLCSNNLKC